MNRKLCLIAPILAMAACTQGEAPTDAPPATEGDCAAAPMIGRFDASRDLLIANYDSKPDVDDLQAVAALGTVLRDPAFACVDYIATHGAYGMQGGDLLPAHDLFDLAFGDNWVDADADREAAVEVLAQRALATLNDGGAVWVAEAGQSDVTAAMVALLPEVMWTRVNVVQHSYWNESQTSPEAIQLVVYNTTYHRVQDGNFPGNGSPAFNTEDGSHWDALLSDPDAGPIWREAKQLSDEHNPVADYVNPAVAAGGLDFSDTAEIAYIFGFADMAGTGEFVARFADGE